MSDAGAATYTIPIYTPPAPGKHDTPLSLQYNSHSGNGILGVGWSLSGVSSITRCPKTPAEEGDRVGVKLDSSDVFCLDNQKLRVTSGVYGASGSQYRTARDTYSLITASGSAGSGPRSFTVRTRSGQILEFGGTEDSRLEHPATGTIRVWMVNKISDRHNNEIVFSYRKDTSLGEQILTEVRHSDAILRFSYEARPTTDPIISYAQGLQHGSTNSRMVKIEVFDQPLVDGLVSPRLSKEYQLGYTQSPATQRSLLTRIQECAPNGGCLPRVAMSYRGASTFSFSQDRYAGKFYGSASVVDFNGKGINTLVDNEGYARELGLLAGYYTYQGAIAWDIDHDQRTDMAFFLVLRRKPWSR